MVRSCVDRRQPVREPGDVVAALVALVAVGQPRAHESCDQQQRCECLRHSLPERKTPHISQSPSTPETKKPKAETTFNPSTCRPGVAKTPIRLEPIRPARDDERDDQPVERDVELVHELVEPLVHEADLDLAVAHLLEHVVQLVRVLARRSTRASSTPAGARASMRCGV